VVGSGVGGDWACSAVCVDGTSYLGPEAAGSSRAGSSGTVASWPIQNGSNNNRDATTRWETDATGRPLMEVVGRRCKF